MRVFHFNASELAHDDRQQRASLFLHYLMAAIAQRALAGLPLFVLDHDEVNTRACLSYYPDDLLFPRPPRITVMLATRNHLHPMTAHAWVDLEFLREVHGTEPVHIEVAFPDDILGLKCMANGKRNLHSTLMWNSAQRSEADTLSEVFPVLSRAYAQAESLFDPRPQDQGLDPGSSSRTSTGGRRSSLRQLGKT